MIELAANIFVIRYRLMYSCDLWYVRNSASMMENNGGIVHHVYIMKMIHLSCSRFVRMLIWATAYGERVRKFRSVSGSTYIITRQCNLIHSVSFKSQRLVSSSVTQNFNREDM